MGIDDLTVDEAHEYKNLAYSSRLTGVSGMGNKTGSQKAMDLHLKIRSLRERPSTSVAFLTGTPISNSVAEMYLVLRNLAHQEMKEMGIDNFDAWRSMYVSYTSAYEPTEAGGIKEVTRLGREWMNMKSLMDLYYSVSDAVPIEDIKRAYTEDNPGQKFPVPDIRSARAGRGRPGNGRGQAGTGTVRPAGRHCGGVQWPARHQGPQGAQQGTAAPDGPGPQGLARPASLDPHATVRMQAARSQPLWIISAQIYEKWDADKGTQLVFLDRSVPKAKGDDKIVEAYDALRDRLDKAQATDDEREQQSVLDALEPTIANEDRVAAGGTQRRLERLR